MILSKLEFIGSYEVIPILLIVSISILSIIFAIYSYKDYQSIPLHVRYALVLSRIIIFFILIVLLLNPIFVKMTITEKKPQLVALIDLSSSVSISKGIWDGSSLLPKLSEQIHSQLSDRFDIKWIGFDSDVYDINLSDSLNATGSNTDIASALSSVVTNYNPNHILLVSDGIVTKGRDPILVGQTLNTPIHTLAVGDSSHYQDLVVAYVDYSSEMMTQTEYAINVGIRNDGFLESQTHVLLFRDGDLIESEAITFSNDSGIQQINFKVSETTEGIQNYKVVIEPVDSEWTTENNEFDISVNYIDNRIEVLYITYQYHPDVSIVKQILFDYPEISISELTWSGTHFIQNVEFMQLSEFDLIVIHGVPDLNQPTEIQKLRSLIAEHNTVLFMIPGHSKKSVYASILSINDRFQSENKAINWAQAQIEPVVSQMGHPILEIPSYNWARSPLVTLVSSGIRSHSGDLNLLTSPQFDHIPVLSSNRIGNVRSTIITFSGYGSYYLAGNEEDRSIITELIGNIVTWSASKLSQDLFDIHTNKSEYSSREPILFNARVSKEDGLPESDAIINLELIHERGDSQSYSLLNYGNGIYSLKIQGLPAGFYEYSSSARREDYTIGMSKGSFTVGRTQQELINTKRQDNLLQQLSSVTNGVAADYLSINTFLNEVQTVSTITTIKSTKLLNLFKNPLWFVLVVLLITTEWLLRRKYLLP